MFNEKYTFNLTCKKRWSDYEYFADFNFRGPGATAKDHENWTTRKFPNLR